MTFAFIAKHRHIWPISWMCGVLGVSRSGFHAWLGRPLSERAAHDAKLVQAIDRSFKASDRTYGARQVWHDVLEEGLACGLHRSCRDCWQLGIVASNRSPLVSRLGGIPAFPSGLIYT